MTDWIGNNAHERKKLSVWHNSEGSKFQSVVLLEIAYTENLPPGDRPVFCLCLESSKLKTLAFLQDNVISFTFNTQKLIFILHFDVSAAFPRVLFGRSLIDKEMSTSENDKEMSVSRRITVINIRRLYQNIWGYSLGSKPQGLKTRKKELQDCPEVILADHILLTT